MPKLPKENCLYRIGDFRLDARARVLLRGSEPVRMPLKATEILLTLVEHSGDVVTKEELLHAVWPDKIVDEANLKQNIAVIRKVLDVQPGSPGHIETFVGRGYRIVGIVEEVIAEPSPAIAIPEPHVELPPHYEVLPAVVFPAAVRPRPSGWIVTALVCAGVALVALAIWRAYAAPSATSAAPYTVSRVTPVTRLQGSKSQPAVSPDGKRVAFLWQQRNAKPPAVWVKSLDLEDPIRIGSREGRHSSPVWSPDGKALAYLWIGIDRTGNFIG